MTFALVALSRVCPLNRIPLSVAALISNTPGKQTKQKPYNNMSKADQLVIIVIGIILYIFILIIHICGHTYYFLPHCVVSVVHKELYWISRGSDYPDKCTKGEGHKKSIPCKVYTSNFFLTIILPLIRL